MAAIDTIRRSIDVVLASIILVLAAPVFLIIAISIRLDSRGPVLYKALRVGERGQLFFLLKFRTMIVEAAKVGPPITVNGDSRITAVGKLLRRTKLDELPQFWNVLVGEMSLVGPRPEDPDIVNRYTPAQREILSYRPGITSPASLLYSNEAAYLCEQNWETVYATEILPRKISIDLEYLKERSIWKDFVQVVRTAVYIFNPSNHDKRHQADIT